MLLRMADGQTFRTLLYCPPVESSAPLPLAVVGIDLGTAFTSVTFRECRHNPLLDDPVVFLRPPGEEKERFPTRIWVGAQGDLVFGSRATEVHREDETAGFLFREIKTLLRGRSRAPEFIDLGWRHNEAIALAQRLFGDAWPQALATRYLRWLYEKTIVPELERRFGTANVNVRYVFSLPVLDYAIEGTEGRAASSRLHQIQRAQMSECIRQAGFPEEQTEFQFEPVCAALGLLYPPIDEPDWPRLGGRRCPIETGHSVAVFDSGGGTTDVVLMRADVEEQSGRVSLEVQSCLGVGTQGETFGGELVTTDLLRALQDPTLVRMPPGARWFEGEMNVEVVLGEDSRRLERDLAEDLKMELAPITCERVLRNREQTIIYPIVLERLMVSYLASLAEELLERVFTEVDRAETRYYLSVGGNTYIAPMQRWIQKFMQDEEEGVASRRRLDIPERYRKLAVAWGAVWVPDARIRNAVPYDLEVASGSDVLLTFRRNTAQEAFYHLSRFQMGPRERREFALHAVVDGGRHRVERRAIVNPLDETALLDVWVGVQNGVVSLSYRLRSPVDEGHKDERTPLWKYRL
jgi:hypothetical protein